MQGRWVFFGRRERIRGRISTVMAALSEVADSARTNSDYKLGSHHQYQFMAPLHGILSRSGITHSCRRHPLFVTLIFKSLLSI